MSKTNLLITSLILLLLVNRTSQIDPSPTINTQRVSLALNETQSSDPPASPQSQVAQKQSANTHNSNSTAVNLQQPVIDAKRSKPTQVIQSSHQKISIQAEAKSQFASKVQETALKPPQFPIEGWQQMTQEQKDQFMTKKAEQYRLAYEKLAKESEERMKKQKDQLQLMKAQLKAKVTRTQQIMQRQRNQMKENSQKLKLGERQMDEFVFDMETGEKQQFKIELPISQTIIYFISIFENKDGVFRVNTDFEPDTELLFSVYQNQTFSVVQKKFFFATFSSFEGKANSSYFFRFYNFGGNKLVSLRLANLLEHNHINQVATVEDVADHGSRISEIKNSIYNRLQGLQTKSLLQRYNRKKLNEYLGKYYIYSICQIVLIGIFCIIQVQVVQKLLQRVSIV